MLSECSASSTFIHIHRLQKDITCLVPVQPITWAWPGRPWPLFPNTINGHQASKCTRTTDDIWRYMRYMIDHGEHVQQCSKIAAVGLWRACIVHVYIYIYFIRMTPRGWRMHSLYQIIAYVDYSFRLLPLSRLMGGRWCQRPWGHWCLTFTSERKKKPIHFWHPCSQSICAKSSNSASQFAGSYCLALSQKALCLRRRPMHQAEPGRDRTKFEGTRAISLRSKSPSPT